MMHLGVKLVADGAMIVLGVPIQEFPALAVTI